MYRVHRTWHRGRSRSSGLCATRPQIDTALRPCVWCRRSTPATPAAWESRETPGELEWAQSRGHYKSRDVLSEGGGIKGEIQIKYSPMFSKNDCAFWIVMIPADQLQSQYLHYPWQNKGEEIKVMLGTLIEHFGTEIKSVFGKGYIFDKDN